MANSPEYHVRRGAVYMAAEKAKPRPGETVFLRFAEGDEWQCTPE